MTNYLEFEKPLAEIEGKAEELRAMARANEEMDVEKEAAALDKKAETLLSDLYKELTPWQKTQVARHPDRPHRQGLHRGAVHRIHAARGRPQFRRRSRGDGRARAARRHAGDGDRPRKGARHQEPRSSAISAWRGPKATARRSG